MQTEGNVDVREEQRRPWMQYKRTLQEQLGSSNVKTKCFLWFCFCGRAGKVLHCKSKASAFPTVRSTSSVRSFTSVRLS